MQYKGYDLEAQFDIAGYICIIRKNGRVVNRVGQIVKYVGKKYMAGWESGYIGKEFEVRAVNRCDETSVEYLLAGFPYLVWEEEIESVEEK